MVYRNLIMIISKKIKIKLEETQVNGSYILPYKRCTWTWALLKTVLLKTVLVQEYIPVSCNTASDISRVLFTQLPDTDTNTLE